MMDNTVLVIVDQTYSALREIEDGHVEVSRPVDPSDPDSPVLCVNASARHCSIRLVNGGGLHGASPPKQYRLARASVSVSPGSLHVARAAADDGSCWKCADVRPNVSEKGLLAVMDTIRARLDAAIRVEASLIEMAHASGVVKSRKVREIVDARFALERMRAELDLDAIMRRMRQKRRRRDVQEISCWPEASDRADEAEVLVKRLRTLHVSRTRCQPAVEMVQLNDADVLMKRLGALQV